MRQVLILYERTRRSTPGAEYEVFSGSPSSRGADGGAHLAPLLHVRMAERILVCRAGADRSGTHDELVTRGGLYAELFGLQAAGYR